MKCGERQSLTPIRLSVGGCAYRSMLEVGDAGHCLSCLRIQLDVNAEMNAAGRLNSYENMGHYQISAERRRIRRLGGPNPQSHPR